MITSCKYFSFIMRVASQLLLHFVPFLTRFEFDVSCLVDRLLFGWLPIVTTLNYLISFLSCIIVDMLHRYSNPVNLRKDGSTVVTCYRATCTARLMVDTRLSRDFPLQALHHKGFGADLIRALGAHYRW